MKFNNPSEVELTPKQQMIYEFIQNYVEDHHVSPSLREIGAHFDLSVGTVQDQVEALRKKGVLEKRDTLARGLRLPTIPHEIPILGQIHAGPLHMSFENVEGHLPVGRQLPPSEYFALKIKGDSMIEAGILEGDYVIVRMQQTADDGDIVVARLEDESTVKRLSKRNGKMILEPANSRYSPIVDVQFSIVGVVVEVRRQYRRWRR